MNKILELEALRGMATLYVFFHHTLFSFDIIQKSSVLGKVFSFGQEAVMMFFLLSGYVISMSVDKRNYSFRVYFKHRFVRIYSVIVIAWIVAYLSLLLLNKSVHLDMYDILINVFMLQDISALKPGVFADPLFGNSPLWSLSYEWWFYILFFIQYTMYKKYHQNNIFYFNTFALSISFIGLITFKLYYNEISLILMYYYIWFSGAIILFSIKLEQLNKKTIIMIVWSFSSLILTYLSLFVINTSIKGLGVHPILELRHLTVSFFSLLLALFFYKYLYKIVKNNYIYKYTVQKMASLAPISFALYVLHYPIKNYFIQYSEINSYVLLLITFLFTVILSYISEIKIYGYIRKKYV